MKYEFKINEFEGPMDLLLHLIKKSDMDIFNVKIEVITKQYLDYIDAMEEMNLDIASEYLVMAAELIEIKSLTLLPKHEVEEDDYEEDLKENLINRLIEYQRYKDVTDRFKELESSRKDIFTKVGESLKEFEDPNKGKIKDIDMDMLMEAFSKFMMRKEEEKPLNTTVTTKEYSVKERAMEIRNVLRTKKKVNFTELFEEITKDYIIVTFLSILSLAKKQEININQDSNFSEIYLSLREGD